MELHFHHLIVSLHHLFSPFWWKYARVFKLNSILHGCVWVLCVILCFVWITSTQINHAFPNWHCQYFDEWPLLVISLFVFFSPASQKCERKLISSKQWSFSMFWIFSAWSAIIWIAFRWHSKLKKMKERKKKRVKEHARAASTHKI